MNHPTYFGTANLSLLNLSRSPLRRGFPVVLLALALGWFALSQFAQAQDGDYGRSNTAEGAGALHTYITTATSATDNTAIGSQALFSDTSGNGNTATGQEALFKNTTGGEQHSHRYFGASKQHHRERQYGQRCYCAHEQHNRQR